ncbi:MAG: Na+/H+ antiporter NhaA [Proteobacteria bacterium]|nr:Na+/H+ antiporter NhaA [Pseudomonadota bacterium]
MDQLQRLIQSPLVAGALLMAMAVLALVMDNSGLSWLYDRLLTLPVSVQIAAFEIDKPLLLWINDGMMAIFFFLIGLEIKREMVAGHLTQVDQVALPGIAAAGGVFVPAAIYAAINWSDPIAIEGWAIPAETDIAFALGVLMLLRDRVPVAARLFLTAVAIFDDLAAIVIIAIFFTADLSLVSLSIAAAGMAALFIANRAGVMRPAVYILIGLVVWASVLKSGVHATLAGFATALFVPLRPGKSGGHVESPLEKLEHGLQPWVAFVILPVFAFANAGVSLEGLTFSSLFEPVTLGILLGLFVGKQVGVFGAAWLAIRLGLAKRPEGVSMGVLYGVSILCGIGFTMSLFIGGLAFEGPDMARGVRVGVLAASLLAAVFGVVVLRLVTRDPAKNAPSTVEA